MNIVIVGGGKVGETICQELSDIADIVLIDNNPKVIESIFSQYDIQAVVGNGANVNVQREAMVENADIFISVTNSDELNIIACIIAKKLGAKYTISRVRSPEYHDSVDFIKTSLGISGMINPEFESARIIDEILKYPTAQGIESFAGGKVNLVQISLEEGSFIENLTLKEFRESFNGKLLVAIVVRGNEVFIPTGNTKLLSGDTIHVTGSTKDLDKFYRSIRKYSSPVESALIIGAGRLSYYLVKKLVSEGVQVKLIEVNKDIATKFSQQFPEIAVINADGTDQDILEEEGISEYDACIALTGIDEENIMISLFAKHKNVKKCIAKVNRTSMLKLLNQVGLDTIITPKRIIADKIVRFVRSISATGESCVEKLYKVADRRAEVLEFIAAEPSKVIGVPLWELNTLENTLVVFIMRNGELIFPTGEDSILANDRVVVVTTQENITDLDDILIK